MSGPGSRRRHIDLWTFVILGGFALVILFLVYPLADVFRYSFTDKETGVLSLSNWIEFLSKKYYLKAFLHSMFVAVSTTSLCLLFGIPLAFFTTRYRIRGATLLNTVAVLALLSPPFIGAYSWVTMLGRNGFVRTGLASLGITLPPIYGALGIILADSLQYFPFV